MIIKHHFVFLYNICKIILYINGYFVLVHNNLIEVVEQFNKYIYIFLYMLIIFFNVNIYIYKLK